VTQVCFSVVHLKLMHLQSLLRLCLGLLLTLHFAVINTIVVGCCRCPCGHSCQLPFFGCSCQLHLHLLSKLCLQLLSTLHFAVFDAVVASCWLLQFPLQSFLLVALWYSCQLCLQLLSRLHLQLLLMLHFAAIDAVVVLVVTVILLGFPCSHTCWLPLGCSHSQHCTYSHICWLCLQSLMM